MKAAARARSLPTRHPLAQAIALAIALGASATQADVFNVTNNADNGPGSLREAVLDANVNPGADQITFSDGLGTIALTSGQIDITDTLTITGPAAGQSIDAGGNSRVLATRGFRAFDSLNLENLTLTGGRTQANGVYRENLLSPSTTCADDTGEGGGVCARGFVTLTNSTVSGNSTSGDFARGGGLYVDGFATLSSSTVSGNGTSGHYADGGGLFVVSGEATLTNSTVSDNSTAGTLAHGGGVFFQYGEATLTNSTVSGNSTAGVGASGGGLFLCGGFSPFDCDATLIDSTVSGNSTAGRGAEGGGIFLRNGTVRLTNSTISGNSTTGEWATGGGLSSPNVPAFPGIVFLTDTIISGNSTVGRSATGGGVFLRDGEISLANSIVSGNSTAGDGAAGGGLSVSGNTTLTNSTVSDNSTAGSPASGGGLSLSGSGGFGYATLINSTVSGNRTTGEGAHSAGLVVWSGDTMLTNSTVTGNHSATGAGGVAARVLMLASTVLAANSGPDGNYANVTNTGTVTLNASNSLFGDDEDEINGTNIENVFTDFPGLASLANNGCAVRAGAPGSAACVQTHALLPDSPAFDEGSNPLSLTTDQRGTDFPRVVGEVADIGAFELGACHTLDMNNHVVSTTETYNDCQIHAGPNMTVTSNGDLTLKSKVRVVLGREVWIEKGGRLRVQIEP